MNNLQDQARTCYKRGDYNKAIELFDRAIGRSPSVQLLDNRAACYEKLNNYSTALKDAKKAIQLHREDAVGYLRAGRLLVKMEKQSVALEIYTHGLKCIKHVGQGYEQLRKVHKELMDQLCPPKSVDPLSMLPRELAETILEYLSFRQRMNACLVSKGWTQFIRSTPNLWQHFDLSGARRKVRSAFVSRAINVARAKLKAATLSNLYDFDKTLAALTKHCPLEELTLLECGLQGHNLTAALASTKSLRSLKITEGSRLNSHELLPLVTGLSDRLENLECRVVGSQAPGGHFVHCPKLRSLSLTFDDCFDHSAFLSKISDHLPALHTLIVRHDDPAFAAVYTFNLEDCTELRHLDIRMPGIVSLRLPTGLNVFKVDCRRWPANLMVQLPMLDELSVAGAKTFSDVGRVLHKSITTFDTPPAPQAKEDPKTEQPTKLGKLSILEGYCAESPDIQRLLSLPRLEKLIYLRFVRCVGIDDDVAAVIANAKMEQLRYLDLTGAVMTGVAVKELVSSLNLETLVLHECQNVSPDAIEWARSKGVAVKYRLSSNSSAGGRKVRY